MISEDLITSIKLGSMVPGSQATFQDPDLLLLAGEELLSKIVPNLMQVRQDFFIARLRVQLQNGLNHYPLPERAVGNTLKEIFFIPDLTQPAIKRPLPKAQIHDEGFYSNSSPEPSAFDLAGDEVIILPTPNSPTGYLELVYFLRPSKLVATVSCAKVTAVSTVAGVTTLNVDTDQSLAWVTGTTIDVLSGSSPYRLRSIDVPLLTVSASQLTLTASLISDEVANVLPKVGDYICLAKQCNIPMIPEEFHPILSKRVQARLMEALGAAANLAAANSSIAEMTQNAFHLIANRVEAEVDVVYDRNGIGGAGLGLPGIRQP